MTETYWSLGLPVPVLFAILGAAAIAYALLTPSAPRRVAIGSGGVVLVVGAIFKLPNLIAMPLVVSLALLPTCFNKELSASVRISSPLVVLFYICLGLSTAMSEKITISDQELSMKYRDESRHQSGPVPRLGLQLERSPIEGEKPGDGDFWSAYNPTGRRWPSIAWSGDRVYWGPHGLTTGTGLGNRVAAWAGVKAKVVPISGS